MEWLFFLTTPSFLSGISWINKISALFVPFIFVLISFSLILLVVRLISKTSKRFSKFPSALTLIFCVITTFSSSLLLIDNFSYSIFKVGILNSSIYAHIFFLIFFQIILLIIINKLLNFEKLEEHTAKLKKCCLILLLISLVPATLNFQKAEKLEKVTSNNRNQNFPNIIFIASDGVRASRMSAYGYERETTPFLNKFKDKMLVFENAYANANRSSGSIMSMLSGKYPTKLGVICFPDILLGENSSQHLPAIFKNIGYKNLQMTTEVYANSYMLNMQNGFDEVNFENPDDFFSSKYSAILARYYPLEAYFLRYSLQRIFERFRKLLFIDQRQQDFQLVSQGDASQKRDILSIQRAISFVQENQRSFVHLHLIGTHGPKFYPLAPYFSKKENNLENLYDDSIRDFDFHFQKLISGLEKANKLENTIIILSSDHDRNHQINERVPLMIYFPNQAKFGLVKQNVQLLDLAPSLLNYLKLDLPEWMQGRNIFDGQINPEDPMISVADVEKFSNLDYKNSPFLNFRYAGVVICDHKYQLNLRTFEFTKDLLKNSSADCQSTEHLDNDQKVKDLIFKHFEQNLGSR